MKKLSLGTPPKDPARFQEWAGRALAQIQLASFEDIELIFDDFNVKGAFTPSHELNVATATLPDLTAFVATLIADMRKRGQNRNLDEV